MQADGSEMNIMVTDRQSIQQGIIVRNSYIVISIRDPGTRKPRILGTAGLRDILYVEFHDAEPADGLQLPSEIVLMEPVHAETIWNFVKRHQDQIGSIICQCEQGMSRSPAVALALDEVLDGDVQRIRRSHQPNQYVYKLMAAAIQGEIEAVDGDGKECNHTENR
jgi:predicted protein tyrosine phosphatase